MTIVINLVTIYKYLDFLLEPTTLGGIAAVVAALISWIIARMKSVQSAATEIRRDGMAERATAFTEIMSVIKTLRADISDLRGELEQERMLRRTAERAVRTLLEEVALLRDILQRANIVPPILLVATPLIDTPTIGYSD